MGDCVGEEREVEGVCVFLLMARRWERLWNRVDEEQKEKAKRWKAVRVIFTPKETHALATEAYETDHAECLPGNVILCGIPTEQRYGDITYSAQIFGP